MFTTGQIFIGNNAHSMEITKNYMVMEMKVLLHRRNQEPIVGQPKLFPDPMTMFNQLPYNDSIVEKTLIHIKAREDADSDTFMFTRPSVTGNLWKLQDIFLQRFPLGLATPTTNCLQEP